MLEYCIELQNSFLHFAGFKNHIPNPMRNRVLTLFDLPMSIFNDLQKLQNDIHIKASEGFALGISEVEELNLLLSKVSKKSALIAISGNSILTSISSFRSTDANLEDKPLRQMFSEVLSQMRKHSDYTFR